MNIWFLNIDNQCVKIFIFNRGEPIKKEKNSVPIKNKTELKSIIIDSPEIKNKKFGFQKKIGDSRNPLRFLHSADNGINNNFDIDIDINITMTVKFFL